MLFAFEIIKCGEKNIKFSFALSAANAEYLAQRMRHELTAPHLQKYVQTHYKNGIVIIEANNLPEAARKVRSEQELHIVMPDLPMWQDPGNLVPKAEKKHQG